MKYIGYKYIGYVVNYEILNSKDFGLLQNRETLVFIATK
ncbi:DNA cytosine methyltransferase [Trichormus azollae]